MSMNPRLLRPTASGFNPRQISGLALWLDAADSQTLYTTDAGPVAAVSSPLDISGCVGWWDASDLSTMRQNSDGTTAVTSLDDPVGYWADKSGNGRHARQATSQSRPLVKLADRNGLAGLDFDGSNNYFACDSGANFAAGFAIAVVRRTGSPSAYSGLFVIRATGSALAANSAQEFYVAQAGGRVGSLTGLTSAGGLARLSGTTVATVNSSFFSLHDAPLVPNTTDTNVIGIQGNITSTVGVQYPFIGVDPFSAARVYPMRLYELIVFDAVPSLATIARVEAYLAAKWGISNVHAPATSASQPVGYWGDKSGNGRHATQTTAARRPAISATLQNGRPAAQFAANAGLSDGSVLVSSTGGQQLKDAVTVVTAAFMGSINFTALWSLGDSAFGRRWSGGSATSRWSADWFGGGVDSGFSGLNRTTIHTARFARIANTVSLRLFGGTLQSVTASPALTAFSNDAITIGAMPALNEQYLNGRMFEVLMYNRVLSDAECRRIEQYLAAKWGITLAPQVSNADAQDWVNRVYANGGTVSAATATAVNTFCNDIDAAGIRDRFYRLNLFAGTSLNAALVPLYRAASRTASQLGNATDTNAGGLFVSGDYAETAGLTAGAATTKYLDTGLASSALPAGVIDSGHLSAWHGPVSGTDTDPTLVGAINGAIDRKSINLSVRNGSAGADIGRWGKTTVVNPATGIQGARASTFVLAQRTSATNLEFWRNTSLAGTNSTSATGIAGVTFPFFVFRLNTSGTAGGDQPGTTLRHYSIGDDLTSSQITSFYNALAAFNTALGRTA